VRSFVDSILRQAGSLGCAASVYGLLSTVHRPPALSIHLAGWKTCPMAVCRPPSAVWI